MSSVGKSKHFVFIICVIAALGGLLFGLDQGFVNGALGYIIASLQLTTKQGSTFAAVMLYGSVIGALCSGFIARKIGRKNTLLITAFVFSTFSLLSSMTTSFMLLSTYRCILGISVGISSFVVPLYLSEIAPARWRGGFIAMYQMMITVGIFLIYVTNYLIGQATHSWQTMFYAIMVPALVMFIGVLFIPKTPRWLMLKRHDAEAVDVLQKTRASQQEIDLEIREIKDAAAVKSNNFSMLKHKFFIKVVLLGVALQMLQQLTGINSVIYYSTSIFHDAGIESAATATILVGLVNMLTTVLAVIFIDKLGRKPIMYFGLSVMIITLSISAVIFHTEAGLVHGQHLSETIKLLLVSSTLIYIFAFAISAGPIMWVICAEIFPLRGRELGMTITTTMNWIVAALVVQFSLPMMNLPDGQPNPEGGAILFFFFALCCLVGIFLMKLFTPETNGVPLEVIEDNLRKNVKLNKIGA